jgi:hypothetical protein
MDFLDIHLSVGVRDIEEGDNESGNIDSYIYISFILRFKQTPGKFIKNIERELPK